MERDEGRDEMRRDDVAFYCSLLLLLSYVLDNGHDLVSAPHWTLKWCCALTDLLGSSVLSQSYHGTYPAAPQPLGSYK